jgi:hypothetical protein
MISYNSQLLLPDLRTPAQRLVDSYRMSYSEVARIWRDIQPVEYDSCRYRK